MAVTILESSDTRHETKKFNARPQKPIHKACFFALAEQPLDAVLKQSYQLFFEVDAHENMSASILRTLDGMPDFALSLSTGSAYENDVAITVSDRICERFGLQRLYNHVVTCVQEALVNAIVHGNLGIDGQFSSQEEFDRYYAFIEQRLAQETFRRRRITILAWNEKKELRICVADEGNEFPMAAAMVQDKAPQGRGLFFIQSLTENAWVGEDRCSLYMSFAR